MTTFPSGEIAGRLLVALAVALIFLLTAPRAATQEIVVGPGQPVQRITDALQIARGGDTIRVLPGTYRESPILIDRSVTLIGEGFPVLDGEGDRTVIEIAADSVVVRGFRIRGAGTSHVRENSGIYIGRVRACVVEGNQLENNFFGIYLAKTSDCRVADNDISAAGTRESTSGNGIHLWSASGIEVTENRISGHRDGIYLEFAKQTVLSGNRSEGNLRYGLHFMFSNETEYRGNEFRRNGAGVAVMYSKGVKMYDNTFEDNWGAASYGLLLKEISDSEVVGNRFRRNTVGI
jgi:nitrous oxidase accessory protein